MVLGKGIVGYLVEGGWEMGEMLRFEGHARRDWMGGEMRKNICALRKGVK